MALAGPRWRWPGPTAETLPDGDSYRPVIAIPSHEGLGSQTLAHSSGWACERAGALRRNAFQPTLEPGKLPQGLDVCRPSITGISFRRAKTRGRVGSRCGTVGQPFPRGCVAVGRGKEDNHRLSSTWGGQVRAWSSDPNDGGGLRRTGSKVAPETSRPCMGTTRRNMVGQVDRRFCQLDKAP
jgi:hypothetical protein